MEILIALISAMAAMFIAFLLRKHVYNLVVFLRRLPKPVIYRLIAAEIVLLIVVILVLRSL